MLDPRQQTGKRMPRPEHADAFGPRNAASAYPLFAPIAPSQRWVIDATAALSPYGARTAALALNIPWALRLTGPLDASTLAASLTETVRRHEVLRTVFRLDDREQGQRILPPARFELPLTDISSYPPPLRLETARQLAVESAELPFDLSARPALRTRLVRLAPDDHVLLLTTHHLVADHWSLEILFHELATVYNALRRSEAPLLPELAFQYRHFAARQARQLIDGRFTADATYWTEQLSNRPAHLDLPTKGLRSALRRIRGTRLRFSVPEVLAEDARVFSRRARVTSFMLLLAAFKVALFLSSRQRDLFVATHTPGRNDPELRSLIGAFINTIVLRSELADDLTFHEFVQRVRSAAVKAYTHDKLPFSEVQRLVDREPSRMGPSLFQAWFIFIPEARHELTLADVTSEPFEAEAGAADFALQRGDPNRLGWEADTPKITISDQRPTMVGSLEYNSELFEEATMRELVDVFEAVLRAGIDDPDVTIRRLAVVAQQ